MTGRVLLSRGNGARLALKKWLLNPLLLCSLFQKQGGPANLKGVWEEKDTPGIRWPDGNKWTVKN